MNVDIRDRELHPLLALGQAQGISPTQIVHEALAKYLAENDVLNGPATRSALDQGTDDQRDVHVSITSYVDGREIPDGPDDCVLVIGLEGEVRKWNTNMERLLGYRLDDMPRLAIQMIAAYGRDSFAALFARGERITEFETQLIHKDGHLVDVIFSLSPWDVGGKHAGVVAIGRDVSALKRRERDAAYVATVAQACNSAVDGASLIINVAKLTAEWADAARIVTPKEGAIDLIACEAIHSDGESEAVTCLREEHIHQPETFAEWEVFETRTSIVREIHDTSSAPSIHPFNRARGYHTIASVPIWAAAEIVGALTVIRRSQTLPFDVQTVTTLTIVAEQVGLAITKVRLLQQVQEQLLALEKAIRYKDDFLAALSHELRTPLSAILGFAVMIVENDAMGVIRRREMAADIVASAALMRSLVNDLLNLIQLREGQFTIQPEAVDLSPLVEWCVRLLMPLMTVKHQVVVVQVPEDLPQVRAERSRLEQVILNLLINANKYTLPEGTIRVDAAIDEHYVVLAVHDTGVGVAPEEMERVFELFERGETEYSRAQGGAGIGLAVSKQIVEAMGGTLSMESRVGEGSTFAVRLLRAEFAE